MGNKHSKENNHDTNHESHHSHAHKHNHGHSHNHDHSASYKNIKIAFILNLVFAILEIIGGILTNSSAILSDAIHDFGDSLSLGLAMVFDKKSSKESNEVYGYGYKRLSVISAIINILVLSVGTIIVLKEAILRLLAPEPILAEGMLAFAILGVVINGFSVFKMKNGIKISERAVMLHLLEDLFGWVAVFIVSIVVIFTDFYILDPILSIIICFIMIRNIYYNVKALYYIIMQATPESINIESLKKELENNINDIIVNSLKIWSLDGEVHVASIIITSDEISDINTLKVVQIQIKDILKSYDINDSTIEISK